jgi:hypothetical protein
MKHLLCLLSIIVLTGCQTAPEFAQKIAAWPGKVLDKAATFVSVTTTNVTKEAVVTATEIVTVNPATMALQTNITYSTNFVSTTNIIAEAKPSIAETIDTGSRVSAWLPSPYGDAVTGVLALFSGGLAWLVKRRNRMLEATIKGVESGKDEDTKKAIATVSGMLGVGGDLHKLVKKVTAPS